MYLRPLQRVALLALVASAFVAQPLVARASAGIRWAELKCCCPDPETCKCHDHDDDDGSEESELRRCGRDGELVVSAVLLALSLPAAAIVIVPPTARPVALVDDVIVPETPTFEPVTPPF